MLIAATKESKSFTRKPEHLGNKSRSENAHLPGVPEGIMALLHQLIPRAPFINNTVQDPISTERCYTFPKRFQIDSGR